MCMLRRIGCEVWKGRLRACVCQVVIGSLSPAPASCALVVQAWPSRQLLHHHQQPRTPAAVLTLPCCHLLHRERQAERIRQQLEQERQVLGRTAGPAPITRELMGSGSDWRVGDRAAGGLLVLLVLLALGSMIAGQDDMRPCACSASASGQEQPATWWCCCRL
jgi:hypothetical protein